MSSQLSQDAWVIQQMGGHRHGYFVELGANDGLRHSNTLALEEQFGWDGVLIEGDPVVYGKLCENRPKAKKLCTVVDYGRGDREFIAGVGMSSAFSGLKDYMPDEWVKEHRKRASPVIYTKTFGLTELLDQVDAPNTIDYLSLDTEGSELAILEGVVKAGRFKFNLMTVEFRYDALLLQQLQDLLTDYRLDEVRAFDAFFVHKDFPFALRAVA